MSTRLLLSRRVIAEHGDAIGACLDGACELHALEDAADDTAFDIAFFSRDIYGDSSKTQVAPAARWLFALVRQQRGLDWLHIFSAGADRPVYAELAARGVRVTTSSGATTSVVAHSALAGLLALARHLPAYGEQQRRHEWHPHRAAAAPRHLAGQQAVVVGLGRIGQEVARLLRAFGVRVIGINRSGRASEHCDRVLPTAQLAQVLPAADWLVLCCPLTPATRGLVSAERIAALPPHAHVVNVARGEVVDEAALAAALQDKRLAGAFLDVFTEEPLPAPSPLWDCPNTIVTPHAAADSSAYHEQVVEAFLANLARWHRGEPLHNQVAAAPAAASHPNA